MNPLDVHDNFVTPIQDPPPGSMWGMPAFGSILPPETIAQLSVDALSKFVQQQSDMVWGRYTGMIQAWNGDNSRGIYNPAPGPAILATVNQQAALKFYETAKGGADVIVYYPRFLPDAAPGTVFQPPVAAPQSPRSPNPVGALIPGTTNIYQLVGGGYTVDNVGELDPSGKFMLVKELTVGTAVVWLKL